MKRLLIVAAFAATSACRVNTYATGPASTDFYGELSPYGEWVTVAPYGSVWRPSVAVVGPDFYPYYTGGSWAHTQYGWTWQSTFNWGWIPFHHGRWITTSPYGWVWVPGDEWAPAWVEWRVGGGNIGWVPLGPQGVATVFPNYHPRWVFVPLDRFGRQNFHHARLPPHREYAAYRAATSIPFQRGDWRRGPSPDLIRRAGGDVRAAPLPAPRMLRPGDVRADRRLGPGASPAVQGRRAQPPPGLGLPERDPGLRSRMPPPAGAPMPPSSSGGELRRRPPGAAAPTPPARFDPQPQQLQRAPAAPARPPPQLQRPQSPGGPAQLPPRYERPPQQLQRAPAAPPMYRPGQPSRSAPPGSMSPPPRGGGRRGPPGR